MYYDYIDSADEFVAPYRDVATKAIQSSSVRDSSSSSNAATASALHFSGFSYRFGREFQAAFPDPSTADWTAVQNFILDLPCVDEFSHRERDAMFQWLVEHFVETAKPFAMRIIDESFLPVAERTVQRDTSFGGIAGGDKFREHFFATRLFKFATDVPLGAEGKLFLYGGSERNDRVGMKSAGHELQSAQEIIDAGIPELTVPLMCVFTYRGKRVTCLSIVPIEGKTSLVQGSCDGGQTIVIPPLDVESVVSQLGLHICIGKRFPGIVGPFDMELHRGKDGRIYVLDAARLFPPQALDATNRKVSATAIYYRLLRPEMLRKAGLMLIPDAFNAKFVGFDSAREDIKRVTLLLEQAVDELVNDLNQGVIAIDSVSDLQKVKDLLHSRGINMRFIEGIVDRITHPDLKRVLTSILREREDRWQRMLESKLVIVKALAAPRARSRADIERVLQSQRRTLGDGPALMNLIPALLQLGAEVGSSVPVLMAPCFSQRNAFRPSGSHPLVQAFDLCVLYDDQFSFDAKTLVISRCSLPSLVVMFRLLALCLTLKPVLEFHFPSRQSFERLVQLHEHEHVTLAMRDWLAHGVPDQLGHMISLAAREGEWEVLKKFCRAFGRETDGACAAAEFGNLQVLEELMLPSTPLSLVVVAACRGGNVDVLARVTGAASDTSLLAVGAPTAARFGHLNLLEFLLEQNVSLADHVDSVVGSCLWNAVDGGHARVVEFLLHERYQHTGERITTLLHLAGVQGLTPLHRACQLGNVDIVSSLCAKDALVLGAKADDGSTCLHYAVQSGSVALVLLLLQQQAHVNVNAQTANGSTPLYLAAQKGQLDMVNVLLENGAHANLATSSGSGPLFAAAREGHVEILRILLLAGRAEVDARDNVRMTPLLVACDAGAKSVVDALLAEGRANELAVASNGWNALHFAARSGNAQIVTQLLARGISANSCASDNSTPLRIACYNGFFDVVVSLVEGGANVNFLSKDQWTPLMRASENGFLRIVSFLLEKGALPNSSRADGTTALSRARQNGHEDVVKVLLQSGASDTAISSDTNSRLLKEAQRNAFMAAADGNLDELKRALDTGASVHECNDDEGQVLLHVAAKHGHFASF
jgi:ankyrin repeat protein